MSPFYPNGFLLATFINSELMTLKSRHATEIIGGECHGQAIALTYDFLSSLGIWILFGYSQLLGGNDDRYGGNQERMTMTLLRDSCGLVECLPRREPFEIRRDIRHVE